MSVRLLLRDLDEKYAALETQALSPLAERQLTLRSAWENLRLIAVEPRGSSVLSGGCAGPHRIQGIGAGFVPAILDRSLISEVRIVDDVAAYKTKRRLAREEGLLVGISAGASVCVALDVAAELGEGAVVVTVLCDTGERYFSMDEYFA